MYKFLEDVWIRDFLMNGVRRDVSGKILRHIHTGSKAGQYLIRINSTEVFIPAERITRWDDYYPEDGDGESEK